ncbi:MAG: GxxExxY protein [Betaproteobacteria bacterium]
MIDHELSGEIIGAAIEVHRVLGLGLLESLYEEALVLELGLRGIKVSRQLEVPVDYKGHRLQNLLRLDLLIGDQIIVEVKSVEKILPVHEAQLLGYLRMTQKQLGLLINFNSAILSRSVRRIVNKL